jgi:CHAD domain-containing protein
MPYRLEWNEAVPEGMKRIARQELESAAGLLARADAAGRDEAIHEARKSLKKVRAILRLMRPEGEAVFRLENRSLRDAGRRLSGFRDAAVLVETLDGLRQAYREELGKRTLGSIRRALMAARRKQERAATGGKLKQVAATLLASAGRASRWPPGATGFGAIAPGLEKTFRQARKAMRVARKQDRPEDFHEWRKRAKDHWYHVRLLENLATDEMRDCEKSLHNLETWLGDDHNLTLLHDCLEAHPESYGRREDVECCLDLIRRRQKDLRGKSLALGAGVYRQKPREFVQELGRQWGAGQAAAAPLPAPSAHA